MDWNKPLFAEENLGFTAIMAMIGAASCALLLLAGLAALSACVLGLA